MNLALERIFVLERDPVFIIEELDKSLKRTTSSKIVINVIIHGNNTRRGVGCENIDSSYNSHTKNSVVGDNLLCLHCGQNGHIKKECLSQKRSTESSLNYWKQWNILKKGHGPACGPRLKKISLPPRTKDFLMTLLYAYLELQLKQVPKTKK